MPRFTRMKHHTERARKLRRNPTQAERLLWHRIRFEQLGIAFRRQHPIAGFVVDFYAPAISLAVELDGGQHAVDTTREGFRTNFLLARGVAILRFWNTEVAENLDGVCEAIVAVASGLRAQTPPLSPPLSGEGNASPDGLLRCLRLALPDDRRPCLPAVPQPMSE